MPPGRRDGMSIWKNPNFEHCERCEAVIEGGAGRAWVRHQMQLHTEEVLQEINEGKIDALALIDRLTRHDSVGAAEDLLRGDAPTGTQPIAETPERPWETLFRLIRDDPTLDLEPHTRAMLLKAIVRGFETGDQSLVSKAMELADRIVRQHFANRAAALEEAERILGESGGPT